VLSEFCSSVLVPRTSILLHATRATLFRPSGADVKKQAKRPEISCKYR
jgi:hypothetical protein